MNFDYTEILQKLHELNWISICLRSVLSMLLGGFLGYDRGKKNRPAGFRTHMLVCFGATMVMMTNQFVYQTYHVSDPVRLGAQVISGIGFLGAGSIILNAKSQVKGITTAAGLWAAACCGLAIGIGFYSGAIMAGIVIYFIVVVLNRFDTRIQDRTTVIPLYLEFDKKHPFSDFLSYAREQKLSVSDIQLSKNKFMKKMTFCVTLVVKSDIPRLRSEVVQLVQHAEGVQFMEEL
ncbi:MgtC/SapB transporter [Treponema primitia ZAS-2]|uniref:MgtC/SapB transporter n=1 Tax=Treponema primitia (strain ATCC BAA-887 / DSM 12427 / ZAS-2) TaxID=545694 RepID=F5YKG4_TREPZ|nr:MgtC/SapB family protein [Treponema primitia]AEF85822.1 MgtC/SapB transporter [Treponema primitia ZAS-2]